MARYELEQRNAVPTHADGARVWLKCKGRDGTCKRTFSALARDEAEAKKWLELWSGGVTMECRDCRKAAAQEAST